MHIARVITVVIIGCMMGSCASSGVQVTEQQAQAFKVDKSTYSEVVAALGEPTSVTSSSNGNRVAVYSYSAIASRPQNFIPYVGPFVSGYDTKSSAVTFIFDSKGILRESSSTQNNMGTGVDLAAGNPQAGPNALMPGH